MHFHCRLLMRLHGGQAFASVGSRQLSKFWNRAAIVCSMYQWLSCRKHARHMTYVMLVSTARLLKMTSAQQEPSQMTSAQVLDLRDAEKHEPPLPVHCRNEQHTPSTKLPQQLKGNTQQCHHATMQTDTHNTYWIHTCAEAHTREFSPHALPVRYRWPCIVRSPVVSVSGTDT